MSTRGKGSKSSMRATLRKRAQPPLVLSYTNAVQFVCATYVTVSNKTHPRFIARQKQLDDIDISYDKYAFTVVKSWWEWCRGKGMKNVPINIFCGKKAWNRFLDMQDSTVRLDTTLQEDWSRSVHMELSAAQVYIGSMLTKRTVPTRLMPIGLIRKEFGITRNKYAVSEALELLNMIYNCDAENYNDIAKVLLRRRGVNADIL